MTTFKRIALCLLAVSAVSAIGVATASAESPAWWVEGSPLPSGATEGVAEKTEVLKPFKATAGKITAECASARTRSALIEGEKKAAANALIFEECSTSTAGCTVSPIETKPLSILLEGASKELKLDFTPASGKEIETISFSGSGCLTSKLVLIGSMACNYPGVESETTLHLLEFTAGSGSKLEVAETKEKAELTGLDRFSLASGKNWSAR